MIADQGNLQNMIDSSLTSSDLLIKQLSRDGSPSSPFQEPTLDGKKLHDHQNAVISFPLRLSHNDNLICWVGESSGYGRKG